MNSHEKELVIGNLALYPALPILKFSKRGVWGLHEITLFYDEFGKSKKSRHSKRS